MRDLVNAHEQGCLDALSRFKLSAAYLDTDYPRSLERRATNVSDAFDNLYKTGAAGLAAPGHLPVAPPPPVKPIAQPQTASVPAPKLSAQPPQAPKPQLPPIKPPTPNLQTPAFKPPAPPSLPNTNIPSNVMNANIGQHIANAKIGEFHLRGVHALAATPPEPEPKPGEIKKDNGVYRIGTNFDTPKNTPSSAINAAFDSLNKKYPQDHLPINEKNEGLIPMVGGVG